MLQDCISIFKEMLEKEKNLIIDNYVPKDGTYLLIHMEGGKFQISDPLEISYNKKIGLVEGRGDTRFTYIAKLDYCSKLVEMNKPIDGKKVIHSNNYLTFFVKKENLTPDKLTEAIIDGYYEVLSNPERKYEKKAKSKEVYKNVEADLGKPNLELIKMIQQWIKVNIWNLDIDTKRKDYLKLFFIYPDQEQTIRSYEQEEQRYLIPHIYNSNDFNQIIDGEIYGLPNNNMGMNSKKPFLEYKAKKTKEPLLLNREEVLLQNSFFEFLMSKVSLGNVNLYADTVNRKLDFYKNTESPDDFQSGFFLRLQKDKNEVAIHDFELIAEYNINLKEPQIYKQVILCTVESVKRLECGYGVKAKRYEVETLINEVFFNKWLSGNYFTDAGDIRLNDSALKFWLLKSRKQIWRWLRGGGAAPEELLESLSLDLIKNSICNGYFEKSVHQLNLRWSLMDYFSGSNMMEENMEEVRNSLRDHINSKGDWKFENDQEYYYAVGQLLFFYCSKLRSAKLKQSLINPFLNAKQDEMIKKRLRQLYKKVNHDIEVHGRRVNSLIEHIHLHCPQSAVDQDCLMGGFTAGSLVYEKTKGED